MFRGKIQMIDDIRYIWKFVSVWLIALAGLIQSIFIIAPETILSIWAMLPVELKASIPPRYVQFITIGILASAIIGRGIKQNIETNGSKPNADS